MTECDWQREQELRAQTHATRTSRADTRNGAKEAASVLADFYEQHGQLSRAMLWRRSTRVHAQKRPADLVIHDPKWQRKVMMWLLGHVTSQAVVARAFRSSRTWTRTLNNEIERKICATANEERHHPTMAATLRLQAAGALPKPFERGAFKLGEPPPDNWPNTRQKPK